MRGRSHAAARRAKLPDFREILALATLAVVRERDGASGSELPAEPGFSLVVVRGFSLVAAQSTG
jgi:hypothetical protein